MTEFKIHVIGPPGEADALLTRLQAAAGRHGFEVQGHGSRPGALSGIDTIIAVVGATTPVAVLVWEIVKHKQHVNRANGPTVELHVHIESGGKKREILEDDEETIGDVERMRDDDGDGVPDSI